MFKYTKSKQIKANYDYYKRKLNELPCTLEQAYKTASAYKHQAFNYWYNYVQTHQAMGLRVLGHNCMQFTLGFIYIEDGEEYFAYITAYNDYCCKVRELENEI
jgi:hypothetical protein